MTGVRSAEVMVYIVKRASWKSDVLSHMTGNTSIQSTEQVTTEGGRTEANPNYSIQQRPS